MTPARTTDGDGPTKATYTTIATAVRVARRHGDPSERAQR